MARNLANLVLNFANFWYHTGETFVSTFGMFSLYNHNVYAKL